MRKDGTPGRPGPGDGAGPFQPEVIEKPWGHELIWAHTDRYVGKVLHVKRGHMLSLQYHEVKDETLHLLRGRMRFVVGTDPETLASEEVGEGWSYRLTPGTVHRMEALTDVDILEASTPELDDVVRLEDRYGRI
ncbi:MAG: cupin [Gemmatimonadota bacterium]